VEPVRSALIAGIAFCGLAVVILSFLPWVTFETRTNSQLPGSPEVSADFSGLDISRSRDIENITEAEAPHAEGWCSCEVAAGDGYFTAALGLVLIASAGIARIGGRPALGGGAAVLAALAAVGVAGFDAVAHRRHGTTGALRADRRRGDRRDRRQRAVGDIPYG